MHDDCREAAGACPLPITGGDLELEVVCGLVQGELACLGDAQVVNGLFALSSTAGSGPKASSSPFCLTSSPVMYQASSSVATTSTDLITPRSIAGTVTSVKLVLTAVISGGSAVIRCNTLKPLDPTTTTLGRAALPSFFVTTPDCSWSSLPVLARTVRE